MEVVASLSQGRTASAQCGLFTHKSVPVIFEPPCTSFYVQVLNNVWLIRVKTPMGTDRFVRYTLNDLAILSEREGGSILYSY